MLKAKVSCAGFRCTILGFRLIKTILAWKGLYLPVGSSLKCNGYQITRSNFQNIALSLLVVVDKDCISLPIIILVALRLKKETIWDLDNEQMIELTCFNFVV